MTILTEIFSYLIDKTPRLGERHAISAVATGSVTIAAKANTGFPTTLHTNHIIERYESASLSADRIRFGGALTVASGLLAHTGANYTDVTVGTENIRLWYRHDIRPDIDILNLINDALEDEYVEVVWPLFSSRDGGGDWAQFDNNVTSWTASNLGTQAKQTTGAESFLGVRSQRTIANATGGYAESQPVRTLGSKRWNMHGIWKADVGTVGPRLVDSAGNTLSTITSDQEEWVFGARQVSTGSVEGLNLRLFHTDNLDEGDWAAAWLVNPDARLFFLPSVTNEGFKVKEIFKVHFDDSAGTDLYNPFSWQEEPLQEGYDYRVSISYSAGNPNRVHLLRSGLIDAQAPLFARCSISLADVGTLSAEADATGGALQVLGPKIQYLLMKKYPQYWTEDEKDEAYKNWVGASRVRAQDFTPLPVWPGPSLRGV